MNKKEEFEAQNKSKGSRVDHDTCCSPRTKGPSTQGSGFSPMGSCKTISDFLDQDGRDNVDVKVFWLLYMHVAYHSMFFAHPIGMKW